MKSFHRGITSLFLTGSLIGATPNYAGEKEKPYAKLDNVHVLPRLGMSAPVRVSVTGSLKIFGEKYYGAGTEVDCGNGSKHGHSSDWPPYEENQELYSQSFESYCDYRQGGHFTIKLELKKHDKTLKSLDIASINVRPGPYERMSSDDNDF